MCSQSSCQHWGGNFRVSQMVLQTWTSSTLYTTDHKWAYIECEEYIRVAMLLIEEINQHRGMLTLKAMFHFDRRVEEWPIFKATRGRSYVFPSHSAAQKIQSNLGLHWDLHDFSLVYILNLQGMHWGNDKGKRKMGACAKMNTALHWILVVRYSIYPVNIPYMLYHFSRLQYSGLTFLTMYRTRSNQP